MILRHRTSPAILLLLLLCYFSLISADEGSAFDCHFTIGSTKFDLTSLNNEHTANRTRETPPSSMVDSLTFNICDNLKTQDGVADKDQCPSGTRACLTKTNKKQDEQDRIVSVIPVAQSESISASYASLSSASGVSLILHGASYPKGLDGAKSQSLKLNLLCSETASDPKFLSYDGSQVDVEWSNKAACGSEGGDTGNDNGSDNDHSDEKESVGSGVGWFFLVLLLAFAAYLGLGAYYNYTTYGATGMDLIPHRDFWKEVPFMLKDVVSHLCSTVRPRRSSSRGGYIAV